MLENVANCTRVARATRSACCQCPLSGDPVFAGNPMALIKKSKLTAGATPASLQVPPPRPAVRAAQLTNGAAKRASNRPQDRIAERLAAATEELASGLTEASAAAEELRRSMEQIASGASEAAGAAQEQLAA